MVLFKAAQSRGHTDIGWLNSRHSFSFGEYYDPQQMGVSVLRVINDDHVKPGAGFPTHGHRDMEIISYVLEGAIEHQDSMGHRYQLKAGEVQRMSAGTGITHSEYNASKDKPLHFLQIWIEPRQQGVQPSYEQAAIPQKGVLTPIVTEDGREGSLTLGQDANLYRLKLSAGESVDLPVGSPGHRYLHLIEGEGVINGQPLKPGDAAHWVSPTSDPQRLVAGSEGLESLWFELP